MWNSPSAFLLLLSVFIYTYFFNSVAIFCFRIIPFSNKLFPFYFLCPILRGEKSEYIQITIANSKKENKVLRRLLLKLLWRFAWEITHIYKPGGVSLLGRSSSLRNLRSKYRGYFVIAWVEFPPRWYNILHNDGYFNVWRR